MKITKRVEEMYRKQLFSRCDDAGTAYYFSAEDFPGLAREPYEFSSPMGHRMQGYFYHYADPVPGRVIVFDHGMGGGHRSYMKEIELLARHGFLVFAYDHTGCMESGGESTNGFAQSLNDLNACLTALKADPSYADRKFSVIGHSWGAYACLNISALHPDLSHIVTLSGPISVEQMLRQSFSGPLRLFRKTACRLEESANPDLVRHNAIESLQKTNAKVLVIHSADDPVVKAKFHFFPLRRALEGKPNISFMLVENKAHNPNYTEDAVRYLGQCSAELKEKFKKGEFSDEQKKREFVAKWDWNRMTAQDEKVWQKIFDVLDA